MAPDELLQPLPPIDQRFTTNITAVEVKDVKRNEDEALRRAGHMRARPIARR